MLFCYAMFSVFSSFAITLMGEREREREKERDRERKRELIVLIVFLMVCDC